MTDDLDRTLTDDEWAAILHKQQDEAEAAALERAKTEAVGIGKEVFDLDRFERLYDTTTEGGALPDRAVRVREWEHRYYLRHRDVMTMQELADLMSELASHSN